jgi:hypothetical protein
MERNSRFGEPDSTAIQCPFWWSLLSQSDLCLENCRHAPHRDCCEATLSAISQFLRASEISVRVTSPFG